ncbi:MAG: hypothetical protein ABIZ05_10935 [Pseudonocardiaceae bacterium]
MFDTLVAVTAAGWIAAPHTGRAPRRLQCAGIADEQLHLIVNENPARFFRDALGGP